MSWDYWAKDCIGAPQWSLGFAETLNMWDLTAIMEIKGDMWFILHPFVFFSLTCLANNVQYANLAFITLLLQQSFMDDR